MKSLNTRSGFAAVLLFVVLGSAEAQEREAGAATPVERTAEAVFATAAPKVVFVLTRRSGELHKLASGILLSADGYIGTNYHVVQGADSVEIRFFSNRGGSEDYQSFHTVKLVYADAERDIAILKLTSSPLPFFECPVQRGCEARIGEKVYAIGNPKGLSNTISEGIVSTLRSSDSENVIQHTAAISAGSSGGALLDAAGDLLGMNSWQVGEAQNLNFATPARHVLEALAVARRATRTLGFPPDTAAQNSKPEERAWQALQSNDYIQAANQAGQALASGVSNSKIYMILGNVKALLGQQTEAEQYFRQALALAGGEDKWKQSSRIGLLRILETGASGLKEQSAFIGLVRDLLASDAGSVEDAEYYGRVREWAASLLQKLHTTDGDWSGNLMPEICGRMRVLLQFGLPAMSTAAPAQVYCIIDNAHLSSTSNGFSGEVERVVMYHGGDAFQMLRVEFRLSDDSMTIEGTATAGRIRKAGDRFRASHAADLLKPLTQTQHGRFALRRAAWPARLFSLPR